MNEIKWTKKATKQLRKIAKPARLAIVEAVDVLEDFSQSNNVIHLTDHQYDYRLRVGQYRVLFNHDAAVEIVAIQEVKKRDGNTY